MNSIQRLFMLTSILGAVMLSPAYGQPGTTTSDTLTPIPLPRHLTLLSQNN